MSLSHEKHTEELETEFDFGIEGLRPLTKVSFRRDNSGKDLNFTLAFTRMCSRLDECKERIAS